MSNPSHETHVPVVGKLPDDDDFVLERPPLPTPSLFQVGVKVRHKADGRENIIRFVDWKTCQFRPAYDTTGRPAGRTTWESFENWIPEVQPSPAELERQAAASQLRAELEKLGPEDLAAVQVLVDDEDAKKALAKLEAMKRLGIVGKGAKK